MNFKKILIYGAGAALILSVPMFGPGLVFGLRPEWMKVGEVVGYTAMLLCLTATFFAMRDAQREAGGTLGFGALLATGVAVAAVAGVLFGVLSALAMAAWGEAGVEALLAHYGQQARDSGLAGAALEARLTELLAMRPMLENRPLQGTIMAATVFLIGVAQSLVGAFWLSRRRATP
jgi:hypothetical protein